MYEAENQVMLTEAALTGQGKGEQMLPERFLDRMKKMLGEEYPAFLESLAGESYRALRVNTRKTETDAFLKKNPFTLEKVPWTENGFYYAGADQPGRHPYHEAGVYYIQEPSAMAPVPFLCVQPGDRVLDLCAAPGGKTTQIADYMQGEGVLVSNEIHPARAKILSENVERMGVVNAIVTNETPEKLAELFPGYFDKVLVDAPCSGEGMFRKNEEAGAEWCEENVALCAKRQDEVLACAARLLRHGGRMVYSTCTFAPEEDEGAVSRFLRVHPEFSLVKAERPDGFMPGVPGWTENPVPGLENTMRLMPHNIKGEGHFLAVFEKTGTAGMETPDGMLRCNAKNGVQPGIPEREYTLWEAFRKEYLRDFSPEGVYLRFGEQLYLGPKDMPALQGLKVLRPGLHLGTLKKDRFEPSHALALALQPETVKQTVELSASDVHAKHYLSGMTLTAGDGGVCTVCEGGSKKAALGAKGWCLVCVDGYSLGWGKLAGGILKNHYPKGLRKG